MELPELDLDYSQTRPLYRLRNIHQHFTSASETITVLNDLCLDIMPGETIAIIGSSGSGKSSLLHILGTLATPMSGSVNFLGKDILNMSESEKARIRNTEMGFVFQFHHMLPEFTTLENVAMPAIIGGMPKKDAFEAASSILEQVGLKERESFNVTLLSGGERQRAAIARAIVRKPKVLLADEPTGNLDEKTGKKVADLLIALNKRHKMAMVLVTHNPELASRMNRCFELKSGDLYDQTS